MFSLCFLNSSYGTTVCQLDILIKSTASIDIRRRFYDNIYMKDEIRKRIMLIFTENHGYVSTGEIQEQGIHNTYLAELEKEGTIRKVKRGLYVLTNHEPRSSLIEAICLVTDGVICLNSALAFYHLTTFQPLAVEIAIEHKRKIVLPSHPPIHLVYFGKKRFEIGISFQKINDGKIRIYNKEKTLCDAVYYRHKIGIDIVKEALRNYIREPIKNLPKLIETADVLRVGNMIRRYLEVLV